MKTASFVALTFYFAFCSNLTGQTLHWAASLGGSMAEHGYALDLFDDGSIITAGTFHGTADFDPGSGEVLLTSNGGRDMYLCRLNGDGTLAWAKSFGGTGDDWFRGIRIDSDGDIIVAGYFSASLDMNPEGTPVLLTSAGLTDALLAKFLPDGTLVWAHGFGGTGSDYFVAVDVDPMNNVVATGQFSGVAQYDPSGQAAPLNSGGNLEILTAKYNQEGDYVWAYAYAGNATSAGWAVDCDSEGNVYTAGSFAGTINVGGSGPVQDITVAGLNDGFVVKWSPSGALIWYAQMGGAQNDYFWGMAINSLNELCVVGEVSPGASVSFPSGSEAVPSNGGMDGCALLLDENGSLIWQNTFGSTANDGLYDCEFQSDNDLVMTGLFAGEMDILGQQAPAYGSIDAVTFLVDHSGVLQWLATMGGAGVDFGLSVKINENDEVYFCGNFNVEADFNPLYGQTVLTSAGGADAFVCKLGPCITFEGDLSVLIRTDGSPFADMEVRLYETGPTQISSFVSAASGADGLATFSALPMGDYVCKAAPNNTLPEQTNLLGTYTNETYAWPLANILTIGCQTLTTDTIDVIQLPPPGDFPGSASGIVFYRGNGMGLEAETRSSWVGDPIPGVPVIIRLDTIPFQLNVTNEAGSYGFTNLPEGSFDIWVDIPGLPMVETHSFSVGSPEFIYENLNFYVDEDSGIYITDLVHVENETRNRGNFSVYPNPAHDMLVVENLSRHNMQDVELTLRASDGRIVSIAHWTNGTARSELDLGFLPSGVYLLEVTSSSGQHTFRIVKI